MSDTSIKRLKDSKDKTQRDLTKASKKHDKTSVVGTDFAKKVGQIKSTLSDVDAQIKIEVNTQMGKVEAAVGSDDKGVQKEIDAKKKEKSKVDNYAKETKGELEKAKKVKAEDPRFGAEKIAGVLKNSETHLNTISGEHKKDIETGQQNRDRANRKVNEAISRNRRK